MEDVKSSLLMKAEKVSPVKLSKSMSISDMIKALEPEIKRALPSVITPERFTRMALSAINNTPKLAECTQMSFLAALMNAAQLGLEPNTPLGQAYLIPFQNKGVLECQFQLGYKGLINLAYRNDQLQTIQAQCVYANDQFEYELGLEPKLNHKPCISERGELIAVYALFKLQNGGYGFEVMSKTDIDEHAKKYSKAVNSSYSPWKTAYSEMAMKTVVKKVLRFAPLKTDFLRDIASDETVKTELSVDMTEINGKEIIDMEESSEEA
ncbi:MAG: recombinase RecT [Lachnospiraceae bacterium]|nr:recombinase RecT [Lachnospiraceae bacterium]